MWLVGLVLLGLSWATNADAACTGSAPNWTATTASPSDITTCVNNAKSNGASGQTITVNAGSGTWGSGGITITNLPNNLTIRCSVEGACAITGAGFYVQTSIGARITGFNWTSTTCGGVACHIFEASQDFRFDHNTVNHANWTNPTQCMFYVTRDGAFGPTAVTYGLVDHNAFTRCRQVAWGSWAGGAVVGTRHESYTWFFQGNVRGTKYNVFLEDNTYNIPAGSTGPSGPCDNGVGCNFTDPGNGGAMVVRFNTVTNSYFEHHSLHGHRGTKNMEVYHNTASLTSTFQDGFRRLFFLQASGTGAYFNNSSANNWDTGTTPANALEIIDYERDTDIDDRWPPCSAANSFDSQTNPPNNGWPCRDQPGVSHDTTEYLGSGTFPVQAKAPWYIWNNTQPSGTIRFCYNGTSPCNSSPDPQLLQHVKSCRDYYQESETCAGAAGVRVGTKAQMLAATCDPNPLGSSNGIAGSGPGWWVTDEGSWNTTLPANTSGRLYHCSATNTWSPLYEPYTYPHPLQGGTDTTPPAAPTGVTVTKLEQ